MCLKLVNFQMSPLNLLLQSNFLFIILSTNIYVLADVLFIRKKLNKRRIGLSTNLMVHIYGEEKLLLYCTIVLCSNRKRVEGIGVE